MTAVGQRGRTVPPRERWEIPPQRRGGIPPHVEIPDAPDFARAMTVDGQIRCPKEDFA